MTDRIPDEVVEAVERFARDGAGDVAADGGLRVRDSAILRLVAAYRASAPVPASVPGVVWESATNGGARARVAFVSLFAFTSDAGEWRWSVCCYGDPVSDEAEGTAPDLESAKAAAIEAAREVTRKLALALNMEVR